MIYVSTSGIKKESVLDIIDELIESGINNIELSGGTKPIDNLDDKILSYKNKNINFLLHNYFPPPKENFVINIASCDKEVFNNSINQCLNAIKLSKKLNAKKYAVHAGFLIDPKPKEIGLGTNVNFKKNFFDKDQSINQMKLALERFTKEANGELKIYLENNVLSKKNSEIFENNPFFLTDKKSFLDLRKKIKFNLLLDLAHLKVSCKSQNLNFIEEANFLINQTDYVHLSGNNGYEDTGNGIIEDKEILEILKINNLKNKVFTLEIYEGTNKINKNLNFLKNLITNHH